MRPKCTRDVETSEHIFRDCPSIAEIWRKISNSLMILLMDLYKNGLITLFPHSLLLYEELVESYIRDVDVVQRKLHVRRVENESWKPPKDPFLKINFDAAFQGNDRRSYSGVMEEGDALSVIKKMRSCNEDGPVIGAYIYDAKKKVEGFTRCSFRHVPRDANRVAHILSREGLMRGGSTYLEGCVLDIARDAMDNDRCE
ncbi:hypothetical protein Goshw_022779 [Gossypium schwendimanii]|uniref:RNase H type-1 domain-containing protein n=1 Tax=Gossypium schwendimanii TaxID=34291 RepID=A0A7J9KTU2_GOSSC|nr:hypothetical protein [Gossypium schwendimanii]